MTLTLKLYGTPQCRRYQRMRNNARQALDRLDDRARLEEINDTARLSQHNPLDLPFLALDGQVIARRNPPTVTQILDSLRTLENK